MQDESVANPQRLTHSGTHETAPTTQHGPIHRDPDGLPRQRHPGLSSVASLRSEPATRSESGHDVDAALLDAQLRGLSLGAQVNGRSSAPGQRISEYESAMTPPTPRRALGFKVIKRSEQPSDGLQLVDFPNEILTQIFSHMHSDSHAAVALVCKRFYALITSAHAWRMAFLRYFPGHEALAPKAKQDLWAEDSSDLIRSEARFFARLNLLASWRKEYLLRTRLIRGLARGKPGTSSGTIGVSARSNKKNSAVLTFNSKLPWAVTNVHAIFANGKKPPKAIQGSSHLGVGTISDPTCGKIEKWGLQDPFRSLQLEEIDENLVPFGLGEGPAANPNVMDVSQGYGLIAGEGFPGGRAYFRGAQEMRGRYLGADNGVVDTYPDIPKIPEMSEAISSVWIAKSLAMPSNTYSMIGMMVGSTLGVVTSYAISAGDANGNRRTTGEMTARWVLSPGVPIISLKVDESYNQKRRASARVYAVALNALGEVYYLNEVPTNPQSQGSDDVARRAWYAGRSVYWHLVEATRRVARPDDQDKNATKGTYSPRSPSNSMNLSKSQLAAEAREIEKFLLQKPSHFRRVCEGWDMQRKLEVDFASDDGNGAGENIFVLDCGLAEGRLAQIQRYTRSIAASGTSSIQESATTSAPSPAPASPKVASSLFGSVDAQPATPVEIEAPKPELPGLPTPTPAVTSEKPEALHEWQSAILVLKGHKLATITSSVLDCSSNALLTQAEDPLHDEEKEIPGRRARLFAIGTDTGAVLVWNSRQGPTPSGLNPLRVIQTESPEISCIGMTALYLVHGGSDGLVQAWDPLASTLDPIRTINARSNGRVPRHMTTMNPALDEDSYSAVGAICLDPDATVLRGLVSFGAFMRYWSYSPTGHGTGRKRRMRHSDIHGRLTSRRQGGDVTGYIAAEEAEMRRETEQTAKEQAYLRSRFGVGALGDLTEEEAIRYAQMISEEAFAVEEQRRTSDSAADASLDTASSFSETTSIDTVTPDPSVTGVTPPTSDTVDLAQGAEEDDYEQQIQQAIRLSLMEGVNESGQSPTQGASSGEYEFSVTFRTKANKRGKRSGPASPRTGPAGGQKGASSSQDLLRDDDLELALALSMADQSGGASEAVDLEAPQEDFPALETEGVGKGKGVRRW